MLRLRLRYGIQYRRERVMIFLAFLATLLL